MLLNFAFETGMKARIHLAPKIEEIQMHRVKILPAEKYFRYHSI
jgi:hypothetical protein